MIIMPKKRYVLNLCDRTLREVVFSPSPRKRLRLPKSKALRAGALTRMVNKILNKKDT